MTDRIITKDSIAEQMYKVRYAGLSAWGRNKVDHVYDTLGLGEGRTTNTTLPPQQTANLREENVRLAAALESAKVENLDLWEENSELQAELAELRASFNQASS